MLTRRMPDGHSETYTINATEIIDGSSKQAWSLQKDDSISSPSASFDSTEQRSQIFLSRYASTR